MGIIAHIFLLQKMNYPKRKTYIKLLQEKEGSKAIHTIKYQQATLNEYIEFLDLEIAEQYKICEETLIGNIKYKWWEKILKKIFKTYQNKTERFLRYKFFVDEGNKVLDNFVENYYKERFKKWDSLYKETKLKKEEERPGLYSNETKMICKEFNITGPNELFEDYTLEQYGWMLDGLIFSGYELSDEGKQVNDEVTGFKKIKQEKAKESASKIRESFEKFGKKFEKKTK